MQHDASHSASQSGETHDHGAQHAYGLFALNVGASFLAMYLLMFSMIDGWSDFYNNINMVYMALSMVAPMALLMLATMGGMYKNRRLNLILWLGFALVFVAALTATRKQALVGDRQFVASMIPHHSGAILMCREADLNDPELIKLCQSITASQRSEIEQMRAILSRLK